MNLATLLNPLLALERLGARATQTRRIRSLRHTPARNLTLGHIDSLELLEQMRPFSPKVIFDVGANIGTWTLLAKSLFPNATIHAFEPYPQNQARFAATTETLRDIHFHALALGPQKGKTTLRVMGFQDSSSLLPISKLGASTFAVEEVESIDVPVDTISAFCNSHDKQVPDIIKLDVQGFELEVLKGAVDVLPFVKGIIAEVSFEEYYTGQCLFHDLVCFLAGTGHFVHSIAATTPCGRKLSQCDVLFLKR